MQKTRIIKYALIVFLLLSSITFAETQEMKKYKVVKGDTLWAITETELADPFRWPEVWKVNPWIKNPHWIYPNQIIKIPLYLLKKEKLAEEVSKSGAASSGPAAPEPPLEIAQPEEMQKEAAPVIIKYPLVDKNVYIASGYLSETIPGVGRISDAPSGEVVFGNNDIFYASLDLPAKVGDKFYLIRVSDSVDHPVTGNSMGYVVNIDGIGEIVKIRDGETIVKVTRCFREIDKSDRLVPYYDIETPMTAGNFRKPDIKGTIVATANDILYQSTYDVVYIDKGCKDGIEAGDLFRTIAVDGHATRNGTIQVLSCKDHTATAIVKYSTSTIEPGNTFSNSNN